MSLGYFTDTFPPEPIKITAVKNFKFNFILIIAFFFLFTVFFLLFHDVEKIKRFIVEKNQLL